MNGEKKSVYFNHAVIVWLTQVAEREGFNFSQAINWVLRKAMEKDKRNNKNG